MQVFPILMKSQQLPRVTVLNCRLLNKWTKNSVDEAIYHQNRRLSPEEIYDVDFLEMEDIQIFNARTENFVGNPFLTKTVCIQLSEEEEIQMVLGILQRFGHEVWSLHLHLGLVDPYRFWHQISQTLSRVPNI